MSASNSFADADYLESEASVLLAHSHAACRLSLITKNQSYRLDSALKTVLLGLKIGRIETDPATPVPNPEEFLATQVLQALDGERHDEDKTLVRHLLDGAYTLSLRLTTRRLWMRHQATVLSQRALDVAHALASKAEEHDANLMPQWLRSEFTGPKLESWRSQFGEPVLVAHRLLSFVWPLLRDVERIQQWAHRADVCPYGCGDGAGTSFAENDPREVAQELGFSRVAMNSLEVTEAVDIDSELHSIARQMAVTVARAAAFAGAMTITDFHATEFSVERITVPEDDYGDAFDGAYRQVRLCEAKFPRFAEKLAVCAFDTERLEREAAQGAMLVPDIIDWCERQGIDPDAASSVARRCWAEARSRQVPLTKLPRETFESIIGPVLAEQNPGRPLSCIRGIHLILDAHGSVESRKQIGGTSTKRVREQLRNVQIEIQRLQDAVGD